MQGLKEKFDAAWGEHQKVHPSTAQNDWISFLNKFSQDEYDKAPEEVRARIARIKRGEEKPSGKIDSELQEQVDLCE